MVASTACQGASSEMGNSGEYLIRSARFFVPSDRLLLPNKRKSN